MAITRDVERPTTAEEERTVRITIRTPRAGNYSVSINREIVARDAEGEAIGNPRPIPIPINRSFAAVMKESVTLDDGTAITIPQIAETIAKLADRWAVEDAATVKG
jgi:hypothetical protein